MSAERDAPTAMSDADAMSRALELARRGPAGGANPRVGCVLLGTTGEVLAEGWHRGAGTPHAEIDALTQLAPGAAKGATAVITLEPCDHTGRTGPCSVALIEAGVRRVVYAVADPNPVAAGGAARLRAAGVEVAAGVGAARGDHTDRALGARAAHRPPVGDGEVGLQPRRPGRRRGRHQPVDHGTRRQGGRAPPSRRARRDRHRYRHRARRRPGAHGAGCLRGAPHRPADPGHRRPSAGARRCGGACAPQALLTVSDHDPRVALEAVVEAGATSAFLEGGPTLIGAYLRADLVDEVLVYLAPTLLGGDRVATGDLGVATITDQRRLETRETHVLGSDLLVVARPLRGKD